MPPYPLKNTVLLTINKALIEEITTKSGFKLYLSPEYNLEQNVSVTGKIASLPKSYEGNLSIGDEVAFSYKVVSDRTFPDTSNYFVPVAGGNTNVKLWKNSKQEILRMVAHQGVLDIFWVGTYFDSKGQFQYGTQGTESEVERWMTNNFTFGNCERFTFKHLVHIDGKDYWKCPIEYIFAKKEGKKIKSVGDRVICNFIDVSAKDLIKQVGEIHIPETAIQIRYYDRATLLDGGKSKGLKKGEVVSFDERYCEKYTIFNKDYFLIKEKRVVGQWINN